MIYLNLTREQAVALLLLMDREQELYSTDHTCPARVQYLRQAIATLDAALDAADNAPSSVEA